MMDGSLLDSSLMGPRLFPQEIMIVSAMLLPHCFAWQTHTDTCWVITVATSLLGSQTISGVGNVAISNITVFQVSTGQFTEF